MRFPWMDLIAEVVKSDGYFSARLVYPSSELGAFVDGDAGCDEDRHADDDSCNDVNDPISRPEFVFQFSLTD